MKSKTLILIFVALGFCSFLSRAQPSFPDCTNCFELNAWYFPTNWQSDFQYPAVQYSNIVNLAGNNGNLLSLDNTNNAPAFLFYNLVETNSDLTTFTNLTMANGTAYLWFRPNWTSTNQGGTGPGDYANLLSLGQGGTNQAWWAWYFSPDGCTIYFASQTNGGSPSVYLSAPVSLLTTNWYNLTLTYGPTNTAFYTNGILVTNGTGVTELPGTNVTFFAIGSDTNGFYQARGAFSDLQTFNFPLDEYSAWEYFSFLNIFYGLAPTSGSGGSPLTGGASFTNMIAPTFEAVTGPGFLIPNGTNSGFPTSSNIWITNYTAIPVGSNVINVAFAVAGGINGLAYDVFATGAFSSPVTNTSWFWMGQAYRGTNYILPFTNLPPANVFIILGQPVDSDNDGLTDAYELFVSHTDPNNATSGESGMLDGWAVTFGLNPSAANSTNSALRSNFIYDPVGRLDSLFGIRSETLTNDFEGNILQAN